MLKIQLIVTIAMQGMILVKAKGCAQQDGVNDDEGGGCDAAVEVGFGDCANVDSDHEDDDKDGNDDGVINGRGNGEGDCDGRDDAGDDDVDRKSVV